MKTWQMKILGVGALALVAGGCGEDRADDAAVVVADPVNTPAERLANARNESWINLEGTITARSSSSFVLDYGDGSVTVEMDDWDSFREGRNLALGDRVSVTGRVDRDLLERAKLEASSVYVHNLGTYFYASGSDEEDMPPSTSYAVAPAGAIDATGYVTAVEGREFTVGTFTGSMRVDTSRMANNPLDDQGSPRVRVADRVYVWGRLDVDPRERNELMADGVVVLVPDRTKRLGGSSGQPGSGTAGDPATGNGSGPATGNQTSGGADGGSAANDGSGSADGPARG